VIRWYDAPTGGNYLAEGTSYTFTATGSMSVYALETPATPLSTLVISEINLGAPDRFEIQNVGIAKDYTGYKVALSDRSLFGINYKNTIVKNLGNMAANSVVAYHDASGSGYWGNNIWWDYTEPGWIIIIDPNGNVVDSVIWGYSASQLNGLNVTIGTFTITSSDLDWTGAGATFTSDCNSQSYRRHGDTNTAMDWTGICEPANFGVPNFDINIGPGCLGARTETVVIAEALPPTITCPADRNVSVHTGAQYSIPDFTSEATTTDNCPNVAIAQSPGIGTQVDLGSHLITLVAIDAAGNMTSCTFTVIVDDALGIGENEFRNNILLYPNPTNGIVILKNESSANLKHARITDVNGRIIKTINISNIGRETTISLENLTTGLYFVEISTETTTIVKSIVKQ